MNEEASEGPKTFISYSWSTSEHEAWVLQLATHLEESGVNIVLDKWDLREGADKYAFMEKMVTDPAVRKVVVVCDRVYAEKADGRRGGVGTETQIISKEVYDQVDATDQKPRAQSEKYFERIKASLGINTMDDLLKFIEAVQQWREETRAMAI